MIEQLALWREGPSPSAIVPMCGHRVRYLLFSNCPCRTRGANVCSDHLLTANDSLLGACTHTPAIKVLGVSLTLNEYLSRPRPGECAPLAWKESEVR